MSGDLRRAIVGSGPATVSSKIPVSGGTGDACLHYLCLMHCNNNFYTTRLGFLLSLCFLSFSLHAREPGEKLDVYRIAFSATGKVPTGKRQRPAMEVYYHPGYLYATQTGSDQAQTSWLIWHKAEKLLKIEGKQGLPLNYTRQLKTNVYLPGEAIDSVQNAAANTNNTGDWDNENEYNAPGYGTLALTEDTATIRGYLCRKAVIQYHFDAQDSEGLIRGITIWYSPGLPPFFLPPFSFLQKIPGAALSIAIEDFNRKTVTLRAYSIVKQQKDITFFSPSKDLYILYPPKTD